MTQQVKPYDVLIVGSGAAAYAAATYARRYNLTVGMVQKMFGGETATAGMIENYPGFQAIDGFALMEAMREQATALGAEIIDGEAMVVKNEYHCFEVRIETGDVRPENRVFLQAKTLIVATGMEHRTLGLPREAAFKTKGVHHCVTCDGPVYRGKRVAVVGGGDSAVKGVNQLADLACEVFLIAREANVDRAEPVNRDRLMERVSSGKVHLLLGTEVREYLGGPPLTGVRLSQRFDGKDTLEVAAVFLAIGAVPRNELAKTLGVRLTKRGEVHVDPATMATNVDGVFACGDVTDASGSFKQIVTGAAQGAIAATSAYKDISQHGHACPIHAVAVPPDMLPAVT